MSRTRAFGKSGFTIIELMVSIGIIGVLLSIAFPALMNSRASARELHSLSNARTVSADMQAYADAYGQWPFAKAGEPTPGVPTPPGFPSDLMALPTWPRGAYVGLSNHWDLDRSWGGLVAGVSPWEEHYETWVSPGRAGGTLAALSDSGVITGAIVSYVYSNSFVASPALWRGGATADESLIAPTRPADVAFPANKVLVWDGDLAYLPRPPRRVEGHWLHATPMAFADGHAAVLNPLDATPGVANPLNNDSATRLHNTPGGVLGRDY